MTTGSRWTMDRGKLGVAVLLALIAHAALVEADYSCEGKSNGDYSNPSEPCSRRYYSCNNGRAIVRHCPVGLYFHPSSGKCDWAQAIPECNKHTEEKANFRCPAEDGDYPYLDEQCSAKFWRCTHGTPELYACTNNQLFDEKSARCSAPSGKCAFCLGRPKGKYQWTEGGGCNQQYLECVHDYGKTAIRHCQNGLVFNGETKLCQPRSAVAGCNPEVFHGEEEGEQHVAEPVGPPKPYHAAPAAVQAPHSVNEEVGSCTSPRATGRCKGEYEGCDRGKSVKRFCAIGLVYFDDYGGCVEPSHSPECPKVERRESRFRCSNRPGVKLARGKCKPEYVHCMGEIAVRQWCAPDEVFDPKSESCVHAALTDDCMPSESRTPLSHDSLSHLSTVCSEEDRQIKRRRALEHCSKSYVQCDDQLGDEVRSCSIGIYDEAYDRCLPPDLTSNCRRTDAIPFYPLSRRRKRIGRSARQSRRRDMFNPTLFKGDGLADIQKTEIAVPPQMEVNDDEFQRDPNAPRRETYFGLNKFSKVEMEVGGETNPLPGGEVDRMPSLAAAPSRGHSAVIANFEGLNFDEGVLTAATAVPLTEQNLVPQPGGGIVVPPSDVARQPPVQVAIRQANVHAPPVEEDLPEPPPALRNVPEHAVHAVAEVPSEGWQLEPPVGSPYRPPLPAAQQVVAPPAEDIPPVSPQGAPVGQAAPATSVRHVLGPVKPGSFCANQKDGVYSYGRCRRDYAVCRAKREIRLTCAPGELFDPEAFHCTRKYGYACARSARTTVTDAPRSRASGERNAICLNRANGRYAIAPCSRFYYACSNGFYQLYQCEFGDVFDEVQRRCLPAGLSCTEMADSSREFLGTYPGTSLPKFCTGSFEIWSDCVSPCGEATCGHSAPTSCGRPCTPGCECRPGYVRLSEQSRICVPQEACLQYTLTNRALDQTYCQFRPDGLYPYPGRVCDQWYLRCHAGSTDAQLCNRGKVFDPVKSQCVNEVACRAPQPTAGGLDSYFCRGKPSGAYNLPGKTCFTLYYLCAEGTVSFGKCSNGYVFDLHLGCVPPSQCDDGPIDPHDLYCAGKRDGSYTFGSYKCFPIYYTCRSGRANFAICQSVEQDLVFNGRSCVPRNNCLGSKAHLRPPMPIYYGLPYNQTANFDPTFCINQPDGAYPIVECTSPYLVCINSVTTIHYCFPGEVFARVNLPAGVVYQCALPKYTLCSLRYPYPHPTTTTTVGPTEGPTLNNELCAGPAVQGLHPLTNDPCDRHYINCTGGLFYLRTCPDKSVFNSTSLLCQGNFACLRQPPPDYRQLCRDRTNGFYTFSLCSQYYLYCQDGIGWVQSCLNPQWAFNGQTMQCSPKQSVTGCLPAGRQWYQVQHQVGDLSDLDMRCQTLGDRGYEISSCQSDYIVCNMGFGDVRSCGSNKIFYGEQQRCVEARDVPACRHKGGDSLCQRKRDGAYPFAPCDQQFYVCWRGFSYVERCGPRQIFSSQLQSCVEITSVSSCLASNDSSTQNDPPTQDVPSPACTTPGAQSMGFCQSSFHMCTPLGELVIVQCGRGDAFDERLRACVPAAVCGREETSVDGVVASRVEEASSSPAIADSANLVGFCNNREDGLYPIANDCGRFVQCSHGTVNVRTCPDGWVFNMDAREPRCDLPRNVPSCQRQQQQQRQQQWQEEDVLGIASPPVALSDSVNSYCADKADGFYRHVTDCTKFIQCFRRRTFVLSCAAGLVFNPLIHVCDFPRRVPDCNIVENSANNSPMDSICSQAEHGAFIRDPSTCTAYHRCVHGKAYRFDCPANLVFNTRLNVCDYPTRVPECSP